ncbi:cystathionine gamma-synthase family protein [Reinekea thalattae]|uniref:Cystathionine gamma-synthase family protein n=1 Tax=Reinekea thalattae TaxID=2593301 RepID=A0A5C8ZCG8_9GAMM|nr:cystathionine gamma-synthase family protein [Reinekea thalattae]TXR54838.1 cystathionine gamma-synthase family protein [Reinekea thalattae]
MTDKKGFTSCIVHHDRRQKFSNGPVHAPIYNSVLYNHDKTQDLIDIFQGTKAGYSYSRQATPTSDSLQNLVNEAEQGIGSLVFATGMAAISSVFLTLLKAGDHLIASQYLFGNTHSLLLTLQELGIEVSLVDTCDLESVMAAKQANTRMVFTETIANPGTQIADLSAIGDWCAELGLVYFVDNTMTSPYLFRPKAVKAALVMNSLSKFFCGHGSVLGGSITDTGQFNWQDYPNIFDAYRKGDSSKWALMQIKKKYLRDMGGSLSADAAYQIAVGAETMALRMDRSNASALALAQMLDAHPKVKKVYYPGLATHPQHDLATKLFKKYGSLLSFDLIDGADCAAFLDSIDMVLNATHLGDNRTLALPMASTIFFEMGPKNRASIGIGDTMIRCSVGIEETDDLLSEFSAALEQL